MRFSALYVLGALLFATFTAAPIAQGEVEIRRADIGFGDRYRVGSWTSLRIEVIGDGKTRTVMADVRVPDGEGVSTRLPSQPFSLPAGEAKVVEVLVRIGQLEAPVEVWIVDVATERPVAKRTFVTRRDLDDGGIAAGDPATTRMIVEIGPTHLGTAAIGAEKSSQQWYTQNVVGRVTDLDALPRAALAYEGVDTVLISTSDRNAWAGMRPDDPRMVALVEWVRYGGRAVLFCGSNAELVIGSGGPLAELAPGDFADMVTTDDLSPLENYVKDNEPLPGRGRVRTSVPRLQNVQGDIELSLGSRDTPLPIIIRARKQLGSVVFVALDVDTPPLQNWKSRNRLVAQVLDLADERAATESDNYYYDGPADLVLTLGQRLDQELESSGIRTPPFLAIAGLVVLYILLIGPGDYFFVKHVLKRMEWTWVTFPAIVVATCLAAYWYADYLKGDSLRVNQLEIVDIDNETGLTRGTLWTHIFSPSPARYYLALDAKSPSGEQTDVAGSAVAWLGRPATGLGGMSADASLLLGPPVYGWSPDRSLLLGAPIEVWSTKTFVSRWRTDTADLLQSNLARTANNLVVGTIDNRTAVDLFNCKLVYGTWAWRLGDLRSGESVSVEASSIANTAAAAKKLWNVFKSEYNFDLSQGSYYEKQQLVGRINLRGLAEMMMLYDALGGRTQSEQWHRHQHFVDLSHILDKNTAMLVGECAAPRSELVPLQGADDSDPTDSMRSDKDVDVVLYRYVLPVQETIPNADPS